MRTQYGIEEAESYTGARELLVRRCEAWAGTNGMVLSPVLAGAMLDSRHFSSDGRLNHWTPAHVRRTLLEWIPESVTAPEDDLLGAPATLRTLLRYLSEHGLRDPRGATVAENEEAIDAAAKEFADAIGDRERFGVGKTVMLAALDRGIDVGDPEAFTAFMNAVQEGRVRLDEDLLERAMERQLAAPGPGQARTFDQLPVRLPPAEELTAAAARSKVANQLRAFVQWLGPNGRALTPAGNVKPADARELIALLGTGDEGLRFRSSAELPGLDLIVTWVKKARLVRKQGARLVPVAKARPLLADPDALWQRAFEAAFDLGVAVCRPAWADEPPSPVALLYDVIVPDVLATIYSMPEPIPVARLAVSVWEAVLANFDIGSLGPLPQMALRRRADSDLERIFAAFEALGAVTSAHGLASDVYTADLDMPDGPFGGEDAAVLREVLTRPGRLVTLSPLGTRAMRQRLLAEGREAGLVGELVGASAAELLGTVAEHYTPEATAEEIALWRAAHGGSLEEFVQAIRDCPFLSRQVALVRTLTETVPEADELLRGSDVGPVVLLAEKGDRGPEDVSPDEATLLMAGSVLTLLEVAGPDAVRETLEAMPRTRREDVVRVALDSGFPARETLDEFRVLVARPILNAPSRPHLRLVRNQSHRRAPRARRRLPAWKERYASDGPATKWALRPLPGPRDSTPACSSRSSWPRAPAYVRPVRFT